MNMFSVFLNVTPVVGHVKGLLHYAMGDTQGGNHAMCASTRSLVVLVAGAAGMAAGPVGAATFGALAGTLWDKIMATDIRAVVVASDALAGMVRGTLWSWPGVAGYITLLLVAVFVNAVARKESFRRAHRISSIVIDRLRSRDQGQDDYPIADRSRYQAESRLR